MAGDILEEGRSIAATKSINVPFSDNETARESEDIDEDKPGDTPEVRKTRSQRRAERVASVFKKAESLESENSKLKADQDAIKQELAQLRGYVAAQAQRPALQQQGETKDEYERRLEAIEERRSQALIAAQAEVASGKITPERQKYWDQQGLAFEKERMDVHVERALAKKSIEDAHRQQQNEGQMFWKQRYPEVYSDEKAAYWARARAMQRIAEGEPDGRQLVESVMEEAKIRFKLGKPPAPPANLRERMSGVSSGGGSSSSSGSGVTMTKNLMKMAMAAYPDLPEQDAIKKWVNKTGKRMRERKLL